MDLNPGFWRGRRALITGSTGFKGSWTCLWLQSLGADVVGFSDGVPTTRSLFEDARVADGMTVVNGDVRDRESLAEAFRTHAPEVVLHMAAQPLVRRSFVDPVETYAVNVMGTVHVLEAARSSDSVRVVVIVTSDKCYENREWVWGYREHEPMGGHDPYSNSKGCAELVTSAYRRSFFSGDESPAVASVRAGNVIGGGDWAEDRLIPDVVRSALEGRTVRIRNPNAVRPWQHVLNPLAGYLMLCERLWESRDFAEAWNFGPDDADAQPVSWILERLTQRFAGEMSWQVDESEQPHEAHYLKVDSSKAHALLSWRPRWNLERALESIARWYEAVRAGEDQRTLTLNEIDAYQSTAGTDPTPQT
jgi:CDP-glucose 4,6-dehydratase